jgi:pSer/pThr/pTyr-binding forkhead associated (FHA) protein
VDGDNVTVCDLGSATGTFLDGQKLNDDECAILSPGMSVSLDVDRGITYEVGAVYKLNPVYP